MRISDWSSDVSSSDLAVLLAAAGRRLGHRVAIEADGPRGVIVRGNREGDAVGRNVRIEDRDDRDAQNVGFLDRQLFLVRVDHEHHVGNAAHVAAAAERTEKRRGGKEGGRTGKSRWLTYH